MSHLSFAAFRIHVFFFLLSLSLSFSSYFFFISNRLVTLILLNIT